MKYNVYLAGPDVFYPNAKEIGEKLKAICAKYNLNGLFPLDAELGPKASAMAIFEANVMLLRQSHGVIANVTPFRGPSADVGTAWEIGFAYGLGRPVIGYSTDHRVYSDRVEQLGIEDGLLVEKFGLLDNLMLPSSMLSIRETFESAAERMRRILDL